MLRTPNQVSLSLTMKQKLVLTLLIAVLSTTPFWLASERVHSASPEFASAPLGIPVPEVKLVDVPAEALIGEQFKFKVTFDNTGGAVGYAPFIDVVLPAHGADGPTAGPCDGISIPAGQSAMMVAVNGGPLPVTTYQSLTTPCGTAPILVTHPYSASGVPPVLVPAGGQLLTLELPFGSFEPAQPKIEVEITVDLHNYADVGHNLTIYARGGFRFGATELNEAGDPPILTNAGNPLTDGWDKKDVTPTVFIVSKTYLGPEGEAVSGPNFVGYYPLQYQVTVNIANGQKVTNLKIDDCLDNNMSFVGLVSGQTTAGSTSSFTSPCLHLSYGTVTGTGSPADLVVTYEFYITQFVGGTKTPVLDPEICANATSTNNVDASGQWAPLDPRDTAETVKGSAKYTLTDKRLAIQKSVKVKTVGAKGPLVDKSGLPIPGDYLEYRLRFQVSDYFTFGELEINDLLSDGQLFIKADPNLQATIRVTDRFGTSQGSFGKSLDVQEYFEENCQGVQGGTRLVFKVSQAMMSLSSFPRHSQGVMTGGQAMTNVSSVPAEGEIVFYVQIQDEFSHQGNDNKKYVDKHDPMNNCVTISGRIYRNSDDRQSKPLENQDAVCSDDSATSLMIKPDVLLKSIIARNGKPLKSSFKAPPKFGAGDTITFKITKTIPSGDWEDLKVQDWAPLPALDTNSLTIPNTIPSCGGIYPAAGLMCLGPNDNVGQPMATSLNPDNSFTLDYGTQNNTANTPRTIELWVSLTLTNKPYADGLFFTNEAQECEFNTFGVKFCQVAVARFELTEPSLRITKGVVWAGSGETPVVKNSSAVFTPSPPAPAGVIFAAPPSCKSFSGIIKSSGLSSHPISSDVSNVDGSDTVLFAIVVENQGSGLNGAFDVRVRDALPTGLMVVSPVCITYGDGAPIATDNVNPTADLFTPGGITLTDPSALQGALDPLNATSAANGHNLAVITFYAQISPEIHPSCYTNRAELRSYASAEGGPSFVKPAGFGGPFSDTANVCVLPKADKCVTATSEPHTKPGNSLDAAPPQPPKVAIGEIVRYRLQVRIPEGVSTAFTLTDILPASMTYMNDNTTRVLFISDKGLASDVPAVANLVGLHQTQKTKVSCNGPKPVATLPLSQITPGTFSPGVDPSFKLGTITNSDYDGDAEFVILEFNALVNNLPPNASALPNRDGVTLSNTFKVLIKGAPSPAATSNPADVKIVEPKLDVVKTASPTSVLPGGVITFTVTVTNNGTTDAFDALITDTLPSASGLSIIPGTTSVTSGCSTPTLNTTTGAVSVPRMGVGCSVTLTFQAKVTAKCPTKSMTNTAKVDYSSLPLNGTPLGLNNLTGSVTPGASGASNGERKYTASGSVTVPLLCTGSLTVTKTIKSAAPFTPPAATVFPVTVFCSPSGPNVTLNLTAGAPTQTVNNIQVGSTCTITEGALPPPIAHPACPSLGWETPTYSPGQSVVIPTAGSNVTVQVQNTYGCKTACATPPAGMVAWWRLDETSGSVVHSIVGNHDGTTQPGAIGTAVSVATAPKVGSALFFGAAKAEVADDPALNFGTGDFSIDAWVRSHQSSLLSAVVDKLDTSAPARGYAFFVQNGKAQLVMADGVNTQTFQSSSTFAADGTWRHVAVTVRRAGGTPVGQFYIDGAQAGPSFTPLLGNIDSKATLLIASHRLSANPCSCEVSLDEIELFKTAVAAGDIRNIFAAGSAGKCRATIGGMKFDDLNGNGLKDGGEPGLPNWTIKATDAGGNPQLTTTDSLGNYSFTVPAPASYTLAEVLQAGWTQTAPSAGAYAVAVTANQAVNNRDFGNRQQQALCDLSIRKEVKPNPLVSGQQATFTVTVKNVGTLPCHGPTLVTESMPAGLTLGSASVPGGSCNLSSGACTYPPGIPVNGTVVFTYIFKVTAQPGASLENCVGLQNAEDKNPANNTTCIPLTVGGTNTLNTLTAKNARCGSLPGLLLGACD